MSDNLLKLYMLQTASKPDRRQNSVPVEVDRRSGVDRRGESRLTLSPGLHKDVVEVKSKIDEAYTAFKGYDIDPKDNLEYYKTLNAPKAPVKPAKAAKPPISAKDAELLTLALSSVPFARRVVNIDKNNKENNHVKAAGLTAIALTNVAEDLRDVMTIFGKTKSTAPKGFYSKYGFFVGTTLEDFLKKQKWGKKVLRLDRTVGDIELVHKIFDKLHIGFEKQKFNKEITHLSHEVEVVKRRFVKFGGGRIKKTIGLALYRMPLLSMGIAALLEIPALVKAKKGDKGKQAVNSALGIVMGTATGALLSAALAPINPVLPVLGLGIGYYLGNKMAKTIGFKLNEN